MGKIDILLVNPNLMKPPVSPVAIDIIAESLFKNRISFEILDLAFTNSDEELKNSIQTLAGKEFHLIAVSVRNIDDSSFVSQDFTLEQTKKIIEQIRENNPAPIVVGGVGFSLFPQSVLKYLNADYGILGDGEKAVLELINCIKDDIDPQFIHGLVYKSGYNIVTNPPEFFDLSNEEPLSRRFVNNIRYFQEGGMVGWETKRGCPNTCAYCADPIAKGKKIRMRSPKASAMELKNLLEMGINVFHTCDCEFNIPESHAIDICNEIINLGIGDKIEWFAYCSPAPFSEELAKLMKKAGCKGINFGADSTSDTLLMLLGRNHTKADILNAAKYCSGNNISAMFDLLIGGICETKETIKETIETMKNLDVRAIGVSLGIRIYPGTVYEEQFKHMNDSEAAATIHGDDADNPEFLKPVYYLSNKIGKNADEIIEYIKTLIGGDERFFFNSKKRDGDSQNYNYNNNQFLTDLIQQGARGAFWHILSK